MDCNPVIVSPEGAVVVDARIRVEEVAPPRPEPALRPAIEAAQGKLNGAMATIFETVIVGIVRRRGGVGISCDRSGRGSARAFCVTLQPHEVLAPPLSPARFKDLLDVDAWEEFERNLDLQAGFSRVASYGTSTPRARGGGVAEMLRSFVAYSRGAGLDMRWTVIEGTPEFFTVTKRLHNFLHGDPGDGGKLGEEERKAYEAVAEQNAEQLAVDGSARGRGASCTTLRPPASSTG